MIFFLFHIEIERKCRWIIGGGGKGMLAPSQLIFFFLGGGGGLAWPPSSYAYALLYDVLSSFLNAVIRLSYAPKAMKRGVIVTLFKGGNKSMDNPDNCRAITLSSVVLKLLESCFLKRIELFDTTQPPLHPLQGVFVNK